MGLRTSLTLILTPKGSGQASHGMRNKKARLGILVMVVFPLAAFGPNSGREPQRRSGFEPAHVGSYGAMSWIPNERGRWSWRPANVTAVRGSYGPCRLCKNHTPGGWRRCPTCVTWCGAGCEPERCWAGDDVNLCRVCLQRRDRRHAICVVRDRELLCVERVVHYIG